MHKPGTKIIIRKGNNEDLDDRVSDVWVGCRGKIIRWTHERCYIVRVEGTKGAFGELLLDESHREFVLDTPASRAIADASKNMKILDHEYTYGWIFPKKR